MKRTILLFTALSFCAFTYGQGSAGLVAHWNLNGSSTDVSGNGHNGTLTNVTPAVGRDGVTGHAYYFNGTNSMITAPYSPAFNMTTAFTICAVVKPMGFYNGACQGNTIFARGKTGTGTGTYLLQMSDWAYDLNCSVFDSTKETFAGSTEGISYFVGGGSQDYTPHVAANNWYKVVFAFNDTSYKIYENDQLKSSVTLLSPGVPIASSGDSVCIGYNVFEAAAGYPYPFKGLIDDVMLYNRVLNDSEIVHYTDTCGHIVVHPATRAYHAGDTTTYTVTTSILGAIYQWQQDLGSGFVNLANTSPYSGVFTPTLTITGVTSSLANARYRCTISNSWGCSDTSHTALLTTGIDELDENQHVSVFPNPSTGIFSVSLPGNYGATVQVINPAGQLLLQKSIKVAKEDLDLSDLAPGLYILRVECNGYAAYERLLKQ